MRRLRLLIFFFLAVLAAGCGARSITPAAQTATPRPPGAVTATRSASKTTPATATVTAIQTTLATREPIGGDPVTPEPEPVHTSEPPHSAAGFPTLPPVQPAGERVIAAWQTHGPVSYAWSKDGTRLLAVSEDAVRLLDAATLEEVRSFPGGSSASLSVDGRKLVIAEGQRVTVYNTEQGLIEVAFIGSECASAKVARFFSKDDLLLLGVQAELAPASSEGSIDIYLADSNTTDCGERIQTLTGELTRLETHPSQLLAAVNVERGAQLEVISWSISGREETLRVPGKFLAFAQANDWLAVENERMGVGQETVIFDISTGLPVMNLPAPGLRALWLGSSGLYGDLFIAAGEDNRGGYLSFYEAGQDRKIDCLSCVLRGLSAGVNGMAVHPTLDRVLVTAGGEDGQPQQAQIIGFNTPAGDRSIVEGGPLGITQSEPVFASPLPMHYPPMFGTIFYPEPIATPAAPLEAFQFEALSEDAHLALIDQLGEFAAASDVYGPSSGRGSYVRAQEIVRLAIREFLLRFPGSRHETAVLWRLALANALSHSTESDAWIAQQLEKALNDGAIEPTDLEFNRALMPVGFVARGSLNEAPYRIDADPYSPECPVKGATHNPMLVANLFGDGMTSQLIIVTTYEGGTGLVLVIHQTPQDGYRVLPVTSHWALSSGKIQNVAARDVTGDRRPEIWVDAFSHSGTMMDKVSAFYQWRGSLTDGEFVQVEQVRGSDFFEPRLTFLEPGKIQYTWIYGIGIYAPSLVTMTWDGEQFEMEEVIQFPIPAEDVECGSLEAAVENGQFSQASAQIRAMPFDLRLSFLLGVSEAMQFKPDAARAAMQAVIDSGVNTDQRTRMLVEGAQVFLDQYQNADDLFRACEAVAKLSLGGGEGQILPCPVERAFQELAQRLNPRSGIEPAEALRSTGANIPASTLLDVNGDRASDTLVFLDLSHLSELGAYSDRSAWLLVSGPSGYHALWVTSLNNESGAFQLETMRLPGKQGGEEAAFLLTTDQNFFLFEVQTTAHGPRIHQLAEERNVANFEIQQQDRALQMLIEFTSQNYYSPPDLMVWDADKGQFLRVDLIKHLIFNEGRYSEAIRLINREIASIEALQAEEPSISVDLPWLQYLRALAYELSGEEEIATALYYELWQNASLQAEEWGPYPYDPYATISEAKLQELSEGQ